MRLMDADGTVLEVNDAYCRMVEMEEARLRGQPFAVAYRVADQSAMMDRFRQTVRQGTLLPRNEREVTLWNGKTIWIERLDLPGAAGRSAAAGPEHLPRRHRS